MNTQNQQTSAPALSASGRDYYFDNIKAVFISLVVFGHLLTFLELDGMQLAENVRTFIYIFHMPGFIFLSGYLAKNFLRKPFKAEKLLSYAWLYLLFKDSIEVVHYVFDRPYFENGSHHHMVMAVCLLIMAAGALVIAWAYKRFPSFQCAFMAAVLGISLLEVNIVSVGAAPWYLLSLVLWYMTIYVTQNMEPKYILTASIILSSILNYQESVGKFLSLSRTINFLPFFLLGFYMTRERFYKIVENRKLKAAFLAVFAVTLFCTIYFGEFVRTNLSVIIFGVSPYSVLPEYLYPYAAFLSFFWLILAFILMFAVFMICPKKQGYLSSIGKASLSVYVLHRLFKDIIFYAGFYDAISQNPVVALLEVALMSLLMVVLFGHSFTNNVIMGLSRVNIRWLYKKEKTADTK